MALEMNGIAPLLRKLCAVALAAWCVVACDKKSDATGSHATKATTTAT